MKRRYIASLKQKKQGSASKGETVTTTTASEAVETPFVLTSGTTVERMMLGHLLQHLKILQLQTLRMHIYCEWKYDDCKYGASFQLEMVQALLTERDLTIALSLLNCHK